MLTYTLYVISNVCSSGSFLKWHLTVALTSLMTTFEVALYNSVSHSDFPLYIAFSYPLDLDFLTFTMMSFFFLRFYLCI